MKYLITGASGTLGSALCRKINDSVDEIIAWDRSQYPPVDPDASEAALEQAQPGRVIALATASQTTGIENEGFIVNVEWPERIARLCAEKGIPFLYTSSVMVFSDDAKGPFRPESIPDAPDGYGYEKRVAEERILQVNPDSRIARIGWQIGHSTDGNNMLAHLSAQAKERGAIGASRKWLPACSFLEDSADGMIALFEHSGGLYQLDSNRQWNFYQIARAINEKFQCGWTVQADDSFVFDQRMLDERIDFPDLSRRLALS